MPHKNGRPCLTPNVAPIAASAMGTGPGEPNNKLVAITNVIKDSIKITFPIKKAYNVIVISLEKSIFNIVSDD
jgi:hypothetical protein